MSVNHLELVKQVAQQLEPIIEKIDSLEFCPFTWDESYHLLRELKTAVAQIDELSEQLYPIFDDDSFCDDVQNKAFVENIKEADNCFIDFSSHFSKIENVLEEEGPKDNYECDYNLLSAQLKKAKQHLDQILIMMENIIDGIKYRLDDDNMTAEVIEKRDAFEIDETKLTAKKLLKMIYNGYKGDIIIPKTVECNGHTYRVTSIGTKAFARSRSLKSVTIPDSVTSIGTEAFADCKSLNSIVIPDSVTSIGEYAFLRCESLTSKVVIGEETIGGIKYLLYCNRTAKVIQKSADSKEDIIIIPGTVVFNGLTYRVTSIGAEAFAWCESLKSIHIPDGVTSIGDSAFYQCSSLTKIAIPDSVTSIGQKAFENCKKLPSIIIPEKIKSIGKLTFSWCFALTEIVIPNSVTSIGYEAFESCSSLESIVIPERVTEIGKRAFCGCSALTSIIVTNGNPRYDSRVNCNAIIETATNTLISGCSQTIIPESVTGIGEIAFANCKFQTITIPERVESIGKEAFRFCESLKSITIPASVKSIGHGAFDMCESLKSIIFQGTIAQWKEIELGSSFPTAVVHCTDGDWVRNRKI